MSTWYLSSHTNTSSYKLLCRPPNIVHHFFPFLHTRQPELWDWYNFVKQSSIALCSLCSDTLQLCHHTGRVSCTDNCGTHPGVSLRTSISAARLVVSNVSATWHTLPREPVGYIATWGPMFAQPTSVWGRSDYTRVSAFRVGTADPIQRYEKRTGEFAMTNLLLCLFL
jgi:hypothetical protein